MNSVSVNRYPAEPEVACIRLSGDIGLDLIPQLASLVERFEKEGVLHWAVDLSGVGFLSSPAVGVLMGIRSRVIERSGSVSLFAPRAELNEKLKLMGVHLALPVFKSEKAFLEHFRWEYRGESRTVHLTLPATASVVPPTRRFIATLLRAKGYDKRETFALESIVDELSNNAIEHGRPPDCVFHLKMKFSKSRVVISVKNATRELSLEEQKALEKKYTSPQMDPESQRGRGIVLVKTLSSKMTFHIDAREVQVEIKKMREEK